jgi:TM2 domain-containing membrane protein YozV
MVVAVLFLFISGLSYVITGVHRVSSTKTTHGPLVRLGGLGGVLPIIIIIINSIVSGPHQEGTLQNIVNQLTSFGGLALIAVGVIIGSILYRIAPAAPSST